MNTATTSTTGLGPALTAARGRLALVALLCLLLGAWRDGTRAALSMGARHGAWCVGCCWLLMAAPFAPGAMSLTWMAMVAALITLEKTLPWGRPVTHAVATVLLVTDSATIPTRGWQRRCCGGRVTRPPLRRGL